MEDLEALRAELRNANADLSRMRDLKNEAQVQAEQWRLAFMDAEAERLRLVRLLER